MNSTIKKWGNSQAVRISKEILETSQMSENEAVTITATPNKIIIEKNIVNKHKTLKDRLAGFTEEYAFEEWDTGNAIGSEILYEEDI